MHFSNTDLPLPDPPITTTDSPSPTSRSRSFSTTLLPNDLLSPRMRILAGSFSIRTVAKNVAFGLEIRRKPKDEVRARVEELLDLVHLRQFADRLPSQLSGGQRQRMALARALAVQPKVLLLDEPFGALDAKVRKELREWLRRLHDEVPVTTVFVTHDQEEALEVADEIVVINDGRIEQVGTPDALYDQPANDFVMGFLGEVTELGDVRLRPHDIEIGLGPDLAGSMSADVLRLTRVEIGRASCRERV